MNETRMSLQRLAEICAAYGGDPRHWPAPERAAAEALCANSAEARALVAEAAGLDQALSVAPAMAVSPQLRARVLSAVADPAQSGGGIWDLFSWRPALPALALALICGIAFGLWFQVGAETDSEDEMDVAMMVAFQDDLEDY